MAGLAISLKYTAFVTPLALVLLLLWSYRQRPWAAIRPLVHLVLPALLVALPWYVKNWFFTGNPVYPFLFGGPFWDAYRGQVYAEAGTGIGLNLWALLRLPLDITLGLRDVSQDGATGPFFLVFLPFLVGYALIRGRVRPPATFHILLAVALFHYFFWTVGVISSASLFQSRLLLPALVLLCPLLAWIREDLWRWDHPRFSLQRTMTLIVGLVLLVGLLIQAINWLPQQPWAYLLGSESRDENLQRRLGGHYTAMIEINGRLPEGAIILFLWEPRSYYCDHYCRPDSILDRLGHLEHRFHDAAAIASDWRAEGVSHVLLWRQGVAFWQLNPPATAERRPNIALLQTLEEIHMDSLIRVGGYELFSLREERP